VVIVVSKRELLPFVLFAASCASTSIADVHELGRRGENERLIEIWRSSDKDSLRAAAIEALAEHPDDEGRRLAIEEAKSGATAEIRIASLRALARHSGSEVIEALIVALADPFPDVREVARASLATKSADAVHALIVAASSAVSPLARASAARLIADAAAARPELRPQAQASLQNVARRDEDARAREEAVLGLGRLGAEEARALLTELMRTDDDPSVRMNAERALAKLGAPPDEKTVVVAVLPLNSEPGLGRAAAQISEYVAARLSAAKVCQVIDREQIEAAISELKKHGAAIYDGDSPSAPQIGQFKMANQIVYGSLQREGLVLTIVLNRLDVSTLQIVPGASATVSGYKADLDRMKVEVTERFLRSFR
jgi:HEAT repeat protein